MHSILPDRMTKEALAAWIKDRSIEEYTDEQKRVYTPEEIADFERKATEKNREVIRLNQLKKDLSDLLTKGGDSVTVDVPETIGIQSLQKGRDYLSGCVERGYEVVSTRIYGIIDEENESLEFFDIEGNHVADRSRKLSAREVSEHLGMFAKSLNPNSKTA